MGFEYKGLRFQKIVMLSFVLVIAYLITACDTENVGYYSEMHQLPTELNLSDVCFINKDTGYVSAGGLFTTGMVFETKNGGATWDTFMVIDRGVNSMTYQNGIFSISKTGNQFTTTTDFVNWTNSNASEGWWNWHKHIRLADNRVLFVGGKNFGDGFVHLKKANESIFYKTKNIEHELRDVVVTPNRTIHVVGYGLVMKSTDEGNSWIPSTVTGDFFQGVDFVNNNIGYVVGEYGAVYKTTNRGDSWTSCRGGNTVFANTDKLLRDVAFLDENKGFIVGAGNQVLRTTDGGKLWKLITDLDGYADYNAISIYNNKAYVLGNNGKLLIIYL